LDSRVLVGDEYRLCILWLRPNPFLDGDQPRWLSEVHVDDGAAAWLRSRDLLKSNPLHLENGRQPPAEEIAAVTGITHERYRAHGSPVLKEATIGLVYRTKAKDALNATRDSHCAGRALDKHRPLSRCDLEL